MYPNFSINEIFGNPINNSLNPKENKRKAGIKKMPRKKGIKKFPDIRFFFIFGIKKMPRKKGIKKTYLKSLLF